jgi:hypothetical protein
MAEANRRLMFQAGCVSGFGDSPGSFDPIDAHGKESLFPGTDRELPLTRANALVRLNRGIGNPDSVSDPEIVLPVPDRVALRSSTQDLSNQDRVALLADPHFAEIPANPLGPAGLVL